MSVKKPFFYFCAPLSRVIISTASAAASLANGVLYFLVVAKLSFPATNLFNLSALVSQLFTTLTKSFTFTKQ
jgi:hypothetical protein